MVFKIKFEYIIVAGKIEDRFLILLDPDKDFIIEESNSIIGK